MSSINEFKANLLGAGPRANRFRVYIPRTGNAIEFLCKTASLPGQTIAPTPVTFRGMIVKLAGDRTFADWEVAIYNDNAFTARKGIEEWMEEIVPLNSSIGPTGYDYMIDRATVTQLGRDDQDIATYEFYNMWPTTLGDIGLDASGTDAIEEFTCTFSYSHFERTL
jgi:hypothetical protein